MLILIEPTEREKKREVLDAERNASRKKTQQRWSERNTRWWVNEGVEVGFVCLIRSDISYSECLLTLAKNTNSYSNTHTRTHVHAH